MIKDQWDKTITKGFNKFKEIIKEIIKEKIIKK